MYWVRPPEGGKVLLGDVVPHHDRGDRANDLVVLDALPAREVIDPAVDLGQLGALKSVHSLSYPKI